MLQARRSLAYEIIDVDNYKLDKAEMQEKVEAVFAPNNISTNSLDQEGRIYLDSVRQRKSRYQNSTYLQTHSMFMYVDKNFSCNAPKQTPRLL